MKASELLEILKQLPEDAEIYTVAGDGILGDYSYEDFGINETTGYVSKTGRLYTSYSNYRSSEDKPRKVFVIE